MRWFWRFWPDALPKDLRAKALTYGLAGAFLFRFIMIELGPVSAPMADRQAVIGGGYLLWISLQHFFFQKDEPKPSLERLR